MRKWVIATLLLLSIDAWAVDGAVMLIKQQPSFMLDLKGFDSFARVLVDSATKSDTEASAELSKLLRANNAAVLEDGSVEFKDVSPAAVVNTPPQILQRIWHLLCDTQDQLDRLNDNQKLTWVSYNQRKNVLFWLCVSLDAKRVYFPIPVQVDPNPEKMLPRDWLKQVKPVSIE